MKVNIHPLAIQQTLNQILTALYVIYYVLVIGYVQLFRFDFVKVIT